MTALRFIGSFLGALVVVGFLLAVGVQLFSLFGPDNRGRVFYDVDLLSAAERRDLADVLGLATRASSLPPIAEIPPLEFRRTVQGFVQLELSIGAGGEVTDTRVLGSTLPPSYDQRAIDLVRARRYAPELVNGRPVAGRRLEIVDFRMEAPGGELSLSSVGRPE